MLGTKKGILKKFAEIFAAQEQGVNCYHYIEEMNVEAKLLMEIVMYDGSKNGRAIVSEAKGRPQGGALVCRHKVGYNDEVWHDRVNRTIRSPFWYK